MSERKRRLATFFDRTTTPASLFLAGALLFPAFLFQQDLGVRLIQVAFFFLLSALCERRVHLLTNLSVGIGIIVFNLIIPTGRVIGTIAGFPVTSGALKNGVARATAVIGMIGISQFAISSELKLPGLLGGLIGRSLFYFQRIMSERRKVDRQRLIESVDSLLFAIQEEADPDPRDRPRAKTPALGFLFLSVLVISNWAILIWSLLKPGLLWSR